MHDHLMAQLAALKALIRAGLVHRDQEPCMLMSCAAQRANLNGARQLRTPADRLPGLLSERGR